MSPPPHLFVYFSPCWVFVSGWALSGCGGWGLLCLAVCGLIPAVASLWSVDSAQGLQELRLTGSRATAQWLWCLGSAACGIFLDLCLLNLQADSQPLDHQERPANLCFFAHHLLWHPCLVWVLKRSEKYDETQFKKNPFHYLGHFTGDFQNPACEVFLLTGSEL